MRIAPQERVIYEQKLLNTARDFLEAEAEEMRKRGRSDWSLELAGSFPETEVVVTYTDAAGRAVDRRFPI